MAQAQNKLGELFVDIGVGGVAKTLKSLNTISASFLMTKNAATQLIKPIANMTHSFGQSAIGIEKMRLTLGTTVQQVQRMQAIFKQHKMEGMATDIQKMSDTLTNVGYQGLSTQFLAAMNELQIPIDKYSGKLEDVLSLFDLIAVRLDEVAKTQGAEQSRRLASWIGQDYGDLAFALERGIKFSDLPRQANELSQKTVNDRIDAEVELQKLQLDFFRTFQTVFGKNANILTQALKKLDAFLTSPEFLKNTLAFFDFIKGHWQWLVAGLAGYFLGGRKGAAIALGAQVIGENLTNNGGFIHMNTYGGTPYNPSVHGTINPPKPNPSSTTKNNLTINNNFNITGNNAPEIAQKVDDKMQQSQKLAYQIINSGGV